MRNFHSYMGGFCENCGASLGYIEVDGGRIRRYCGDACRKAASRKRSKRDNAVSRNEALVGLWEENGITGEQRLILEGILIKHGKEAATLATNAVISAIKRTSARYMELHSRRVQMDELERIKQDYCDLRWEYNKLKTANGILERRLARLQSKEQAISS